MSESFFALDGEAYVATEATRGPWDPGAQHAGPPAALIGREIERLVGAGWEAGRGRPPRSAGSPTGEWICMHAVTLPEPNGIGMADAQLLDARGPIGRAAQTLLIADRS